VCAYQCALRRPERYLSVCVGVTRTRLGGRSFEKHRKRAQSLARTMSEEICADDVHVLAPRCKLPRICRKLKISGPSYEANESFHKNQLDMVSKLECLGFEHHVFKESMTAARISQPKSPFTSGSKPGRQSATSKFSAHMRELKAKRHSFLVAQPSFISPLPAERSGLNAHSIIACLLRDNSNHVAIVSKRKTSEAAAQQTTRVHIGSVGVADVSYQIATALVVGFGNSMAKQSLTDDLVRICNPHCTFSYDGNDLLDASDSKPVFFCVSSTEHFCQVAPRSVCKRDFLQVSTALAKKQLDSQYISSFVSQCTSHLDLTCYKIVHCANGTRIWFSWALIIYLVADVRFHALLAEEGFTDFDVALADAMSAYGHLQVGNRSRRQSEEFAQQMKLVSESDSTDAASEKKRKELFDVMGTLKEMTDEWNVGGSNMRMGVDDEDESDDESDDESESTDTAPSSSSNVSLETMSSAMRVKRNSLLSKKVRRSPSNGDVSQASSARASALSKRAKYTGAYGVRSLEFWHLHFAQSECGAVGPLSCCNESTYKLMISNCSLKHLVSESTAASVRAAERVLNWQMDILQPDADLSAISRDSALYTRAEMLKLVIQDESVSYGTSAWMVRTSPSSDDVHRCVGTSRLLTGHGGTGRALVMTCVSPGTVGCEWAVPPAHHYARVAWSRSTMRSHNLDDASHAVSEAAEATAYSWKVNNSGFAGYQPTMRTKAAVSRRVSTVGDGAKPPLITGITRSVLAFEARILANKNTLVAAGRVCEAVMESVSAARERPTSLLKSERACEYTEGSRTCFDDIRTPCTTPSNVFGVGMHLSECVRFAYSQIHAKQSPLIASIAPVSSVQEGDQELVNPSLRPWALLHPLDISFDKRAGATPRTVYTSDNVALDELPVVATVTVCGESAVPVTSAIRMLLTSLLETTGEDRSSLLRQYRSVLFMSGVQCTTLNGFSNAVSARDMNTSIDGTSKIHNPDNHRCGFFTPFQAYIVGNCNVPRMFAGTSWYGAYGSFYDCGSVASVGNNGKHVVSDGRLPIKNIMMSDEQVDRLCAELGAHTVVPLCNTDSVKLFELAPTEMYGLPRYMVPGLHTALKGLCSAFSTVRRMTNQQDSDTVMSIQVLPFSPFTEAVAPVVNQGVWKGFREKNRPNGGWATHRCDSTMAEASLLSSPLFSKARVKMTQPDDNVFETVDAYAASVFIMASQVGCIAQALHALENGIEFYDDVRGSMTTLKRVCAWLHRMDDDDDDGGGDGGGLMTATHATLGFDALVLINACAPIEFEVGKEVILKAYEHGPSNSLRSKRTSIMALYKTDGFIGKDDVDAANKYWGRLSNGIWDETTDLICMLHQRAATFKNSFEEIKASSHVFDTWVRSLWKLHSPDGITPPGPSSPFYGCKSKEDVNSGHVNCVFVDRPDTLNSMRRKQRGAVFGLSNNAPSQIMSLLTAAFLPGVRVQLARNEGNICLRATCSALKRGENGELPSLKSTSPVNSENDWESFGTFSAKEAQALRQQKAWSINNTLIFCASKHMSFNREYSGQFRGSVESHELVSKECAAVANSGITTTEQKHAEAEVALGASF